MFERCSLRQWRDKSADRSTCGSQDSNLTELCGDKYLCGSSTPSSPPPSPSQLSAPSKHWTTLLPGLLAWESEKAGKWLAQANVFLKQSSSCRTLSLSAFLSISAFQPGSCGGKASIERFQTTLQAMRQGQETTPSCISHWEQELFVITAQLKPSQYTTVLSPSVDLWIVDHLLSKHVVDVSVVCQNASTSAMWKWHNLGPCWPSTYLNVSVDMFLGPSIRRELRGREENTQKTIMGRGLLETKMPSCLTRRNATFQTWNSWNMSRLPQQKEETNR